MPYAASCRLARCRRPGDDELIIRADANQATCNHVLQCLELGLIRGSSGQLDGARRRSKITCSNFELEPSAFIAELGAHLVPEAAGQLLM